MRIGLVLAGLSAVPVSATTRSGLDEVRKCANVKDSTARLECFDAAARKLGAPRFEGRLGLSTEPFDVPARTRLRYQSDGVIFVLYLKDAKGAVLQNLHIGGGGEDSYLIESAGTYSLQINGSEGWRVWLEPE